MKLKVRQMDELDNKSKAEVEKQLLDKHEESQQQGEETVEETPPAPAEIYESTPKAEIADEDVLSYIKNRYNKEVNSLDDLLAERETAEDLPEDVSTYLKYKKDTGRGFDDFAKISKDYSSENPEKILAEFYAETESELDAEEIDYLIKSNFLSDPEYDSEADIKNKSIAKKKELAKALKYFNDQKDKYKIPLESRESSLSTEELKEFNTYKKNIEVQESGQKELSDWFQEKTNEVFSDEFKGFEFDVNGKKVNYSPGDKEELRTVQSDITNFLNKYIGDDGKLVNASEYHRSISMAMNPEKFAKFFYEQGMADSVEDSARKSKNINMDIRTQTQSSPSKDGMQIRSISEPSRRGLRIKSNKK